MFYQILREVIMNSEEMYEMLGGYLNPNGILFSAILATVIQAIVFLVYLSLRGTALYKMNAKLGEKKLWLAFLPCGCFYLLGKFQDDTMPSSSRNSAYTWTAVFASAIYVVLGILLEIFGALPTVRAILSVAENEAITRSFIVSTPLTTALLIAMSIAGLVYSIAAIIIYMNVFRAYAPDKAVKYTIISVVADVIFGVSLLYGIFLFTLRNDQRVGYSGYARARANFYGGYSRYNGGDRSGNGYGGNNAYGNDRDGYADDAYGNCGAKKPVEEPFEEFSSSEPFVDGNGENLGGKNNPGDGDYGRKSDDGDDLFS